VEENNESLVKLLNLYEWVAGLTKSGQKYSVVAAAHAHENPIIYIEVQWH